MPKKNQAPDLALAVVLRRLREGRGESQEALAYRAGLSSGSLANIELGRSNPSWVTLRALAAALDVSLVDLAAQVEGEA
jgi:XRE family transcriptional regulator, regulator of sulfur utilization